jgi:cold shock CspA family protein
MIAKCTYWDRSRHWGYGSILPEIGAPTRILIHRSALIGAQSLKVGDVVRVDVAVQPNGSFRAKAARLVE